MMKTRAVWGSRRAFTFLELMIVTLVIGILATAGLGKYHYFAEQARTKTCCTNQSHIEKACALWTTNNVALCEICEGAQWWRKDGHSSSHGWSTPPPFSDSWNIANILRDNRAFTCPKVLVAYNGVVDNIPNTWGYGLPAGSPVTCWSPNYVFYYNGTGWGGNWNGAWGLWYDPSGNATSHQLVFCGFWGGYSCDRFNRSIRLFIHSARWSQF